MLSYREISPPARLKNSVECFWAMENADALGTMHRVMPDGCVDILYLRHQSTATLQVVGAMTEFRDVDLAAGQFCLGVRFRPGMAAMAARAPLRQITDSLLPLEDLWGTHATHLLEQITEARSTEEGIKLLANAISAGETRSSIQKALAFMELQQGGVSLNHLTHRTGLSTRQFRRRVQQETGLSPKLLARILRFRYALGRVEAGDCAAVACESGYADQSHLIAEFRRFSGRTPASYVQRWA